MKHRPTKADRERDNTPEGIQRRADYALEVLKNEARIVAADVGPLMAVCSLLGAAMDTARDGGVTVRQFQAMLIDVLHDLNHPGDQASLGAETKGPT